VKSIRTVSLGLIISLGIALGSFSYQRIGPAQGFVGTECGNPQHRCYQPVLNGGFPLPFVIDRPTVSFPNVLYFEDEIRVWAFLTDTLFYLILIVATRQLTLRQLKRKGSLPSPQS
jgi:hypothetical protein